MEAAQQVSRRTMARIGPPEKRFLHITGAACVVTLCVGVGKLVMGLLSLSFFTCVSAFYTFGMVAAKGCAMSGSVKELSAESQYRYYQCSGLILIIASVLYMIYSVRLLIHPVNSTYSAYVAINIAAFTFVELTMNIRGVMIERKNRTLLVHAIKMINLASSLICLVLTQTAILSFASDQANHHPATNGFFGIIMGGVASILGVSMLIRIYIIHQKERQT